MGLVMRLACRKTVAALWTEGQVEGADVEELE